MYAIGTDEVTTVVPLKKSWGLPSLIICATPSSLPPSVTTVISLALSNFFWSSLKLPPALPAKLLKLAERAPLSSLMEALEVAENIITWP